MTNFNHKLWREWQSGLDWGNFDFSEIPGEEEHDYWQGEQEWKLQDDNKFYYPLYGLGTSDSFYSSSEIEPENDFSVAVVGAGPAYNVNSIWGKLTTASYREAIQGPPQTVKQHPVNEKRVWATVASEFGCFNEYGLYCESFENQKQRWEEMRRATENKMWSELSNLVDYIYKIDDTVEEPDDNHNPFNHVYFTNFMKDGEFKSEEYTKRHLCDSWTSQLNDKLQFHKINSNSKLFPDSDSEREWTDNANVSSAKKNKEQKLCEYASREFWLPILSKELSCIDPDIIVACGESAKAALARIYVREFLDGSSTDPKDILSENAAPDIICRSHWGAQNNNWDAEDIAQSIVDSN